MGGETDVEGDGGVEALEGLGRRGSEPSSPEWSLVTLAHGPQFSRPGARKYLPLCREGSLRRGAYTAARPPDPERPTRWYCLIAAFMVESPSVSCLVRLPITSLPRESTNS